MDAFVKGQSIPIEGQITPLEGGTMSQLVELLLWFHIGAPEELLSRDES